jgi:hypothetical protein
MELLPPAMGQVSLFEGTVAHASFDQWWAGYPRKIAKPDALRAFLRVPLSERHWLLECTPLWVAAWAAEGREKRFIPHPASFVNKGYWREAPPEVDDAEPAGFAGIRTMLANESYL